MFIVISLDDLGESVVKKLADDSFATTRLYSLELSGLKEIEARTETFTKQLSDLLSAVASAEPLYFFPIWKVEKEKPPDEFILMVEGLIRETEAFVHDRQPFHYCPLIVMADRFNSEWNLAFLRALNDACTEKAEHFIHKAYLIENALADGTQIANNPENLVDLCINFLLLLPETDAIPSRDALTHYQNPSDVFPKLRYGDSTEKQNLDNNELYATFNVCRIQYPAPQVADYCVSQTSVSFLVQFFNPLLIKGKPLSGVDDIGFDIPITAPAFSASDLRETRFTVPPMADFKVVRFTGNSQLKTWMQNYEGQIASLSYSEVKEKIIAEKRLAIDQLHAQQESAEKLIQQELKADGGFDKVIKSLANARENLQKHREEIQRQIRQGWRSFVKNLAEAETKFTGMEKQFLEQCRALPRIQTIILYITAFAIFSFLPLRFAVQKIYSNNAVLQNLLTIATLAILSFLLFYFSYYRPHRAAWKGYQAIRQELLNTAQQLSEVVIQKARCMLNTINLRKLDRFSFFLKQRAEALHLYEHTLKQAQQEETDKLSSETPFSPTESLFTKRPIKEGTITEEMKKKYQMFQLKEDEYRWQYLSQFIEPLFLGKWELIGMSVIKTKFEASQAVLRDLFTARMQAKGLLELLSYEMIQKLARELLEFSCEPGKLPLLVGRGSAVSQLSPQTFFLGNQSVYSSSNLVPDVGFDRPALACHLLEWDDGLSLLLGRFVGDIGFYSFYLTDRENSVRE